LAQLFVFHYSAQGIGGVRSSHAAGGAGAIAEPRKARSGRVREVGRPDAPNSHGKKRRRVLYGANGERIPVIP
jgi:hypothetical protein